MAVDKHYTNGAATFLWATAANWDPAGVPAVDDNVFIGGRTSDAITGAVVPITPARVTFRNYSGSFGENGNPVIFEAAAPHNLDFLQLQGPGKFFINTDADVTVVDTIIAATQFNPAFMVLQGGTYTRLAAVMGYYTFSGTAVDIYQAYITDKGANTFTVITSGATVTNMRQIGGRSTISKTLTGDFYLDDGAQCTYAIGDIDGLTKIMNGARLTYNSKGGDIQSLEVFNRGLLDFTQSQEARSITALCVVHPGGKIDASGVDELITITPTILQLGQDATILPQGLGTRFVVQPGSLV